MMQNRSLFQKRTLLVHMLLLAGLVATSVCAQTPSTIEFGCKINADEQIRESRALAKSIASPGDSGWRAKGDLHRKYHFPAANADMPYRLCPDFVGRKIRAAFDCNVAWRRVG